MNGQCEGKCTDCGWEVPRWMPSDLVPVALMDHRYNACLARAELKGQVDA